MDLTQVLEATLSPDTQQIQLAQRQLEQAAESNLVGLILFMSMYLVCQ